MLRRLAYVLAIVSLLGGCGSMKIEDFKGTSPEFKIEEYFAGRTKAWGIFEDRFGNLKRQFTVDIEGTWDGETLTLVEDFVYADGETDQRIWKIRKTGPGRYVGTADDIEGEAVGRSEGKALTWSYDFNLKLKSGEISTRFEDWFYLQDEDVLVNRTKVTKFGIELGEATIFFHRMPDTAPASEDGDQAGLRSDRRRQAAA